MQRRPERGAMWKRRLWPTDPGFPRHWCVHKEFNGLLVSGMRSKSRIWISVSSGFWFIPSLIVVLLIGLAFGLTELDRHVDAGVQRQWPALMSSDANSAREMLSAISSAIITVAGVVFSITIVTLTLASTQYSSRAVRAFMRDKVSQFILGWMTGTFAYCTAVLLMIAGAEDSFVPSIAVFVGYVLGTAAVFALIVFIHHVTNAIQAASIIAIIAVDTKASIEQTFTGAAAPSHSELSERGASWQVVVSRRTGYILSVDIGALAEFAGRHRTVVRMDRSAGDFVMAGKPLISVRGENSLDERQVSELNRAHQVGRFRTVDQDPDFGIRQIVDIALKALSPGVNDTTTAVMCADYLAVILTAAAGRWEQGNVSEGRELRVVVRGPTFDRLLSKAYDQIRQNANGNVAVITALLNTLDVLFEAVTEEGRRGCVRRQVLAIEELVRRTVPSPLDRSELHQHVQRTARHTGVGFPTE